jgi:4-hydroxy-3-polyprenylbenzoate decarboxylase
MSERQPVTVAMTGASGAQYGLRLIECLVAAERDLYVLLSKPAQVVIGMETDLSLPGRERDMERYLGDRFRADAGQIRIFGREEWTAPVASGSARGAGMVICPCTTGTLAGVAAGNSRNLIERAADVSLKEGRKLVLVVRETPFSAIHLENMLRVTRAGACVLPANPGFYNRPSRVEDLVDFVVARILDQLQIPHALLPRWGQDE